MKQLQPSFGPALPQRQGHLHGRQAAAKQLEGSGVRALVLIQRFQCWFQGLDRLQRTWPCVPAHVDAQLAEAQGRSVPYLQLLLHHVHTGDLGDHQRNAGPIAQAAEVNGDVRAFVVAGDQAWNHPGIQR